MFNLNPFFLAAKLFLGGAFEFIKKHFIPVVIALMALTIWHYYAKADRIQFEYDQHLSSDATTATNRKLENYFKEKSHQKDIDKANADGKAELEKYKLNRERETKNLKDLYENRIDTNGRNWSERVRLEQERASTSGLPSPTSDTGGSSEGERECNSAFIALEDACRITTVDYNKLRKWSDSVCELVGCK